MVRKGAKTTRGRPSRDDRVVPSTSGNREISSAELGSVLEKADIRLEEGFCEELRYVLNSRLMELEKPYLDWSEAKQQVGKLVQACTDTAWLLREIALLGESDIGRPQGSELLSSLDYDFNHPAAYNKITWVDAEAYLNFIANRIESEFISVGGRADPYYSFINEVGRILSAAGALSRGPLVGVKIVAEALDGNWPGVAFPPGTYASRRHDYIHNARRAMKGW